jgi:CHAT domain-containing protein
MIDLLMQVHRQNPSEGADAAALQVSEQARARSLLDSLAEARVDIRQGADPVLLDRERASKMALNAKAIQQMRLLRRKHSSTEAETLAEEIHTLTAAHEEVEALIRSKSPHYAALTQPVPLTCSEIQRLVLDEETLLLEYALGEERSYLWAVTPATVRSYELPKRIEIERCAHRVLDLILVRQGRLKETALQLRRRIDSAELEYRRQAAILSRMLLGPVSDQLESKRLLVVAEGALHYLPFGALPSPARPGEDDQTTPLIANHEIVNLPSASALAVLRNETRKRPPSLKILAAVADPVFEADDPRIGGNISSIHPVPKQGEGLAVSRLPATREEANSIMALVPQGMGLKITDFDANRTVVARPELAEYRIVHFATHGFLNGDHPELSGLMMSLVDEQGRPQDGFLRLHDIYNLKLPVELVVLSACDSALGQELRGEGVVGIVRGFMYAGAARVVASLWKVEDEATAALMKRFYSLMLEEGKSPAAALRAAQLDLSRQTRWQSPFYWAAFVLQGEWKKVADR